MRTGLHPNPGYFAYAFIDTSQCIGFIRDVWEHTFHLNCEIIFLLLCYEWPTLIQITNTTPGQNKISDHVNLGQENFFTSNQFVIISYYFTTYPVNNFREKKQANDKLV